jgi:Xaa-Pro aminopeptidase
MSNSRFQSFTTSADGSQGAARVRDLRALLKQRGLDGYLIARADEHQNEYLPASEERLAWLSGFTGSAGFGIVLMNKAAIFSDGRYTEQLARQIDQTVFAPLSSIEHPPVEWLALNARKNARIGYDPRRHTTDGLQRFKLSAEKAGYDLVASEPNPVDALWTERPAAPCTAVTLHPIRYCGQSTKSKLAEIQRALQDQKQDALLITDPTGIAWLFNVRGGDVTHMPLPIGTAIVPDKGRPQLFMDGKKLSNSVRAKLEDRLDVLEPPMLDKALAALGKQKAQVRVDRDSTSVALVEILRAAGAVPDFGENPISLRKAVKNRVECEGARQAQIRDGAAMANFLCWLDAEVPKGKLTEIDAAVKLETLRIGTKALRDISFDTISAAGPNAALPHYRVNTETNRCLKQGIFLIDSGGQYRDGTTDITRTIAIGKPGAEMMDRNTRVLKGMIAITNVVFPTGVSGAQIDSFARQFLWQAGLEFDHGTGHGVGSYLGVHEGPQRIAKLGTTPLKAGMILSNEPGYYKPGHYGIRIENLVLVEERVIAGAERPMLGFETLTFCPIDRRLIKASLLTQEEKHWLNSYHAQVFKRIAPLVEKQTRAWLKTACAPL